MQISMWAVAILFVGFSLFGGSRVGSKKKLENKRYKSLDEYYAEEEGKKHIQTYFDNVIGLKYISGFKDKSACNIDSIVLTEEDLQISFKTEHKLDPDDIKYILKDDIKNVQVTTECEINEEALNEKVSLQKNTEVAAAIDEDERRFLLIKCKHENYDTTLVFESDFAQEIFQKMRETYFKI